MEIKSKLKVSVQEMKDYYAKRYPFEPNNRRVGKFAKSIGFKLEKQMTSGKTVSFYVNVKKLNEIL